MRQKIIKIQVTQGDVTQGDVKQKMIVQPVRIFFLRQVARENVQYCVAWPKGPKQSY